MIIAPSIGIVTGKATVLVMLVLKTAVLIAVVVLQGVSVIIGVPKETPPMSHGGFYKSIVMLYNHHINRPPKTMGSTGMY